MSGLDLVLRRPVAIKILRDHLAADERYVAKLMIEGRIVAQLSSNPHVVNIYDIGLTHTDAPFIVMELLSGQTLRQMLEEWARPARTWVFEVGQHVASALADAHSKGVVHRDLKPENIFVMSTATFPLLTKVLDFGIARSPSHIPEKEHLTEEGFISGTPAYMAPEVADGDLSTASDVFSFGVVLHELCTGSLPYSGATPLAQIVAHAEADPLPLPPYSDAGVQWPEDFQRLLQQCMARDPRKRPVARDILRALARIDESLHSRESALPNTR